MCVGIRQILIIFDLKKDKIIEVRKLLIKSPNMVLL